MVTETAVPVTATEHPKHGIAQGNPGDEHSFNCICGAPFTGLDSLKCHIRAKTAGSVGGGNKALLPCALCYKYDGVLRGFSRRDHPHSISVGITKLIGSVFVLWSLLG